LEFLDVRLAVMKSFAGLGLTASGVLVINPPYMLEAELETIMPVLKDQLAEGSGAAFELRSAVQ
ncbi:MAG: 23S rRNA (adenine(2030)-N(6))-methyltransferase RlmJ, partial [Hyphomicrobium sp.]|nr:23S rRNA (adenine(2030)-N(6))-methyltransferase RlmJ [Hyphomicrobium sp.]